MKEYNWREERKKYRPDFRNEQDTAAQKQQEAAQPAPAPVQVPDHHKKLNLAVIIAAGIAVIAAGIFFVLSRKEQTSPVPVSSPQPAAPDVAPAPAPVAVVKPVVIGTSDSTTMLSEVAERHKRSVGLVSISIELENGKKVSGEIGTAWAFAPNKFATNAHVALGLREKFKALGLQLAKMKQAIRSVEAQIIINDSQRKILPISQVQIHRDYGLVSSKRSPDVAILTIAGNHDSYFPIAPRSVLYALKAGDPIAFLGFPMERLDQENMHIDDPLASMQSGIVVAVSDFEMKDSGASRNILIRHNLPSTGGASGSPIFNKNGEVIALLFAGNVIWQITKSGQVSRAPSAAQINFAIRADILSGVGAPVPIQTFLK